MKMTEENFNTFYTNTFKVMVHFTYTRVNNYDVAEELVQDSFIEFYLGYDFINVLKPFTYLYLIIDRNIKNYYEKKSSSEIQKDFNGPILSNIMLDPSQSMDKQTFIVSIVKESIQALPETLQDIVNMTFYGDHSLEETGDILNTTKQNICLMRQKALKMLRVELKKRGLSW